MDHTFTSRSLGRLLLLLFLTGLQPALSSDGKQTELDENKGMKVSLVGPDYVTVGVPSSIECYVNCSACTYSMSLDGQIAQGQGNVIAFTLSSWVEALTVTCTATNDDTGQTATTTKILQVLAGPSAVSIVGPTLLISAQSYTYSCHAYCRPSCNYTWRIDKGPWMEGKRNTFSIPAQDMATSTPLTCKATNRVSGLYVTATERRSTTLSDRNLSTLPKESPAVLLFAFVLTFTL